QREQQQVGIDSFRIWARHSDDNGQSWSEPLAIYDQTGHGCRSNGIKLSSGELLLPVHSFAAPHVAGVLRSDDGGKTWKRFGKIETPEKIGAAEPTIAELSNGRVLMALRTRDGFLWTTRSNDRGETWEPPRKTDLVAAAASHNLLRLSDGRVVLTHCASAPPLRSPLTMRVSTDEGQTWGPPLVLDEVAEPSPGDEVWSWQVTYPSATQLRDGTILVVWTRIELAPDRQFGIIESAKVRVE
ncbi:MAG TPA: sialidase family protein, partial [Tepidisphaeraceae bacterium]|nr:sialidase family protein [Tepidisphaeraceae bacterium]